MPTFQIPTSPREPRDIEQIRRRYYLRFRTFRDLESKICRSISGSRFVGRIKAIGQ